LVFNIIGAGDMSRVSLYGLWLVFVLGLGAAVYNWVGSAQAEGVDDFPARSYEELKQERERFGPRGDRNPMLKPGEHPDDPDYSSKKQYRVSFWGPGLVSPRVWEVNHPPEIALDTGGLRIYFEGKQIVLGGNWTIEEL
jgi:hypothetical protein